MPLFFYLLNRKIQGDAMDNVILGQMLSHRLTRSGVLLLLLGLLTGLFVPKFANPKMGLSSHVEGIMGGMMLIILGFIWPKLWLKPTALKAAHWLALYGAYANWVNPLIAAAWDAGGSMMPGASKGKKGTPFQEMVISVVAVSLVVALLPAVFLVLWGLRRNV
jgi:hydroxylaminobenzene mutase